MKPPAVFYEFALECQDPRETDLDLDQTVKLAVSNLSKAERAELAEFLSKTLAARYSDVQLRDLWRAYELRLHHPRRHSRLSWCRAG